MLKAIQENNYKEITITTNTTEIGEPLTLEQIKEAFDLIEKEKINRYPVIQHYSLPLFSIRKWFSGFTT